jgi:uncharacterized protein
MTGRKLIDKTADYVKAKFANESTGHDWWHIYRVWQLAKHIAKEEPGADLSIVELGALLHDIADFKFHGNDLQAGPKAARQLLKELGADEDTIKRVSHIVENVSFKGAAVANKMVSQEGKIVQDADRLDAIGAIGIARAFAYGGSTGRQIHDPEVESKMHDSFEAYATADSPTINHFYEKLLLLKDKMNTETGKQLAVQRHEFMENYLKEFYAEWEGEL